MAVTTISLIFCHILCIFVLVGVTADAEAKQFGYELKTYTNFVFVYATQTNLYIPKIYRHIKNFPFQMLHNSLAEEFKS